MILSYSELRREVQNKMISPVLDKDVNGSSIDVHLGATLLVEWRNPDLPEDELTLVSLSAREPLDTEEVVMDEEGFMMAPGTFLLASTVEVFNLPNDITAEFRLNSSAARQGLGHALAVWCDPGWHGSAMTLELSNTTQHHMIHLKPGDRIGQVIFHRHTVVPKARAYGARGAYNNDLKVAASKPNEDG